MLCRLIFSKFRAILGGKVRTLLSGGAPLAADTHDFIRTCLVTRLLQASTLITVTITMTIMAIPMTTVRMMMQGYGLTECCSTACIPDGEDLSTGRVGPPLQVTRNINNFLLSKQSPSNSS